MRCAGKEAAVLDVAEPTQQRRPSAMGGGTYAPPDCYSTTHFGDAHLGDPVQCYRPRNSRRAVQIARCNIRRANDAKGFTRLALVAPQQYIRNLWVGSGTRWSTLLALTSPMAMQREIAAWLTSGHTAGGAASGPDGLRGGVVGAPCLDVQTRWDKTVQLIVEERRGPSRRKSSPRRFLRFL